MLCRSAALRNQVWFVSGRCRSVHSRLNVCSAVAPRLSAVASVRGWHRPVLMQNRCISVQPLHEPSNEPSKSSDISQSSAASQLRELAADMASALHSSQSLALNKWADRIDHIGKQLVPSKRVGVLYVAGKESQTARLAGAIIGCLEGTSDTAAFVDSVHASLCENTAAPISVSPDVGRFDDHGISFLATTVANTNKDAFADWLYSCEQIVLVADRKDIMQTLISTSGFWLAMRFHPQVHLAVDGLESNPSTAAAFSDLLHESLAMLDASVSLFGKAPHPVVSLSAACARPDPVYDTGPISEISAIESLILSTRNGNSSSSGNSSGNLDLLACSLDAAIACVENGGVAAFVAAPPSNKAKIMTENEASALATSRLCAFLDKTDGSDLGHLSLPSKRIQDDFEAGDLGTVDTSVGAIKTRVRQWFASGKIWQSLFMRVYEVSDTLIDDAIVDRSFEEADLGMVHAAGRLNESLKRIAFELANEIDSLSSTLSPGTVAMTASDPSAVLAARNALRALALQKEPVNPFRLARNVWAARKQLAQSDIVENIPRHIHISLVQFWSIHAAALAGATASTLYLDAPTHVAMAGGLGVSILAFVWLGRRWAQLRTSLYEHLDSQGAFLRTELAATHKSVLQSELDSPISACVKEITGLQCLVAGGSSRSQSALGSEEVVSAWKSRLASALA